MILTLEDIEALKSDAGAWKDHVTERLGMVKTKGWTRRYVGTHVDDKLYYAVWMDRNKGRWKGKRNHHQPPPAKVVQPPPIVIPPKFISHEQKICRYCKYPFTFETLVEHSKICRQLQETPPKVGS